MLKNTAGQSIGAQVTNSSTGLAFAGTVTVYITGDRGVQAIGTVGSGICTNEGNGFYTYAPSQAETNYDHIAFTFVGTGAIATTTQVYTDTSAILTSLGAIQTSLAGTEITVTGYATIDTNGVLQLKRAETATLTFTSTTIDIVPDLTSAKVFFGVKDNAGRTWMSIEGSVLVPTGLQSVQFVLTPALSLALIKGTHFFDVLAVYGYNVSLIPPYTSLKTMSSGRATVTDVYLDPLEL